MSVVKDINIARLNNGDFYQFTENMVTIVTVEALAAGIIQQMAQDVPILLDSYKKEVLTEETKQIVALDKNRDRAYIKLKNLAEAYAYDDETPANITASAKLGTFIKQHGAGKLTSFDYNKETAAISSLVGDIRMHANDALTTLKLESTLNYLEVQNVAFKTFYAARNEASSVLATVTPFYILRKEVAKHYKAMVSDVESLQRVFPADANKITTLITRMNIEIDKFRLLVPSSPDANE